MFSVIYFVVLIDELLFLNVGINIFGRIESKYKVKFLL